MWTIGDTWKVYYSKEAASNTIRVGLTGCPTSGEPVPCIGSWEPYYREPDGVFSQARQNNQTVLLQVGWYGPGPDGRYHTPQNPSGDDGGPPSDSQLYDWAKFINLAIQYAHWVTQRPVYVEAWNEPNLRGFWGTTPSAYRYAVVYYYAWQGVQDAEAVTGFNYPVMTAGGGRPVSACKADPDYICDEWFLRDTMAALSSWGAAGRAELTGAHIYPSPNNRASRADSLLAVNRQWDQIREVWSAVPTFITEVGVRSDQPDFGEQYQCDRLLDIYNDRYARSNVAGMLFYSLFDLPENKKDDRVAYANMGLLRDPAVWGITPKLSFWWLRARHWHWTGATSCS